MSKQLDLPFSEESSVTTTSSAVTASTIYVPKPTGYISFRNLATNITYFGIPPNKFQRWMLKIVFGIYWTMVQNNITKKEPTNESCKY